ncbi:MAG: hypothetical protein ACLP1X_19025 [Polyangiaceae bacterium]|jgi:hypothetical protein
MGGRLTDELRKATRAQSQLHPVDEERDAGGDLEPDRAHGAFGWVSLLVVAALAIGGFFVVRQLQADSKMQDCVMSGRKNCAPVDTDGARGAPAPP